MARHNQGRLALLLVLSTLAVASCRREVRPNNAFLPKRITDTVASSTQSVVDLKKDHLNDVLSSNNLQRGGGIPLPASNELSGAAIFLVLDHLFRKIFQAKGISFPSQLGGCCILFVLMNLLEVVKPGLGDTIFTSLTPGAGFLAKWLPVFFVPGLAMLPLAPSMGSPVEILKVLLIVVVGFYYSAATVAFTVLGLRKLEGSVTTAAVPTATAPSAPAAKPYSDELMDVFLKSFVLTGVVSIGASLTNNEFATPLRTLFMTITTFFGYIWGARLPAAFCKVVHPLVTSTVVTLAATQLEASITGGVFNDVLGTYKAGSMNPMSAGAGDLLLYLLGPAVVSFAISIYSRKQQIVDNLLVVCSSMMVGSAGGLFGTAVMVRLLKLGGEAGCVLRKSVLPRNVTTPLAVAITQILKGNVPQACAIVVFTGIYGATFGASFMDALGITDPVSRGMGVGASGQGLGVASMMKEPEAFPFAAVSMVLTAIAATTLVSIPAFADALVKLSCGN